MSVKSLDPAAPSMFLTVQELAELLHVNEKKIYQLAGDGDLPGTKITGKWIFPRHLVEDWVTQNSHGGVMNDRLIIVGSDDRLLNQVCNRTAIEIQHSALLSYCPCGTRHGLRMLDAGRADACFINWGASEHDAKRHLGLLRGYKHHTHWVVVRCLQRSQGLIVSASAAKELTSEEHDQQRQNLQLLGNTSLNWALPNDESGAERLLQDACVTNNCRYEDLQVSALCNSERSAVAAVSTGAADITCGAASTAHEYNLHFVPLATVSLDLVMSQRTYFRTLLQQLLSRLVDEQTRELARTFHGYSLLDNLDVVTVS